MAEDSKRGTDWQDDELDMIVADYFSMLIAELSGQAYVKSGNYIFNSLSILSSWSS